MKGKFRVRQIGSRERASIDPQEIAIRCLGAIAGDPDRLDRFLLTTGLEAGALRQAATNPGFFAAVLDHVADDEPLLLALAAELTLPPEHIVAAQQRLSPPAPDE